MRMDWTLRELRTFVAVADEGTLTDAANALGVSQATASRTVQSLERHLGGPMLRRHRDGSEPTALGALLLPAARRLLADAERLEEAVRTHRSTLRLGYSWSAVGRHTTALLRSWPEQHPDIALQVVRHDSPTGGLAEGRCDVAILRTPVEDKRFDAVVVGLEPRLVVFATDDPQWRRRRRLSLAEVASRPVGVVPATGTTSRALWAGGPEPELVVAANLDEWLDLIASGRFVGVTSAATAVHHQRAGVVYRPLTDAPPVPVQLVWWRDPPAPAGLATLVATLTDAYRAD